MAKIGVFNIGLLVAVLVLAIAGIAIINGGSHGTLKGVTGAQTAVYDEYSGETIICPKIGVEAKPAPAPAETKKALEAKEKEEAPAKPAEPRCSEGTIAWETVDGSTVCTLDENRDQIPDVCEEVTLPQDKIRAVFPLSKVLKLDKKIDVFGVEKKEIEFTNLGTVQNRLYNTKDESYINIIDLKFDGKKLKFESLADPSSWVENLLGKCYAGYTKIAANYGVDYIYSGAKIGELRTPSEPKPPVKNIETSGEALSTNAQDILNQLSATLDNYTYAVKLGLEVVKDKDGNVVVKEEQIKGGNSAILALWSELRQQIISDLQAATVTSSKGKKELKVGINILYQPQIASYKVELNSNDCLANTTALVEGEKKFVPIVPPTPWCELDRVDCVPVLADCDGVSEDEFVNRSPEEGCPTAAAQKCPAGYQCGFCGETWVTFGVDVCDEATCLADYNEDGYVSGTWCENFGQQSLQSTLGPRGRDVILQGANPGAGTAT